MLIVLMNLGFAATLQGDVSAAPVSASGGYGVHFGLSVSTGNQLHDSQTRGVGSDTVTGKEVIR